MTNQKTLLVTVILLVIINLATLSFMWFTRRDSPRLRKFKSDRRSEMIFERRLKLTEEQVEAFRKAREEHFALTTPLLETIHTNSVKLNDANSFQLEDSEVEQLTTSIGEATAQLEKYKFMHIQELRSICNEKQKKEFDAILNKVLERGPLPKMRKRRRHNRRHE